MKNAYIKNLSNTKCDVQLAGQKLMASGDSIGLFTVTWEHTFNDDTLVLGDAWERSYGDLCFRPVSVNHVAPWYFLAQSGDSVFAVGIKTGANAFVSFTYTANSVTALVDARCGAAETNLKAKENLESFCLNMALRTGTLWEFDDTFASCCHGFQSANVCWLLDTEIKFHSDETDVNR